MLYRLCLFLVRSLIDNPETLEVQGKVILVVRQLA